jgi:hypothetical protein
MQKALTNVWMVIGGITLIGLMLAETARAAAPPLATIQPAVLPAALIKPILKAIYECRDKTGKGAGCSAGCASASFAPLTRLTVVLGTILIGDKDVPIYYYLAEFPQPTGKTPKPAPKAEGFILSTNQVCGTVNMDLIFSTP